tara:strand:+ start:233 stop:424 length:192 start_codon:yes stop_codon:yes gene_type:complete
MVFLNVLYGEVRRLVVGLSIVWGIRVVNVLVGFERSTNIFSPFPVAVTHFLISSCLFNGGLLP